jgi:hypothetical protein
MQHQGRCLAGLGPKRDVVLSLGGLLVDFEVLSQQAFALLQPKVGQSRGQRVCITLLLRYGCDAVARKRHGLVLYHTCQVFKFHLVDQFKHLL